VTGRIRPLILSDRPLAHLFQNLFLMEAVWIRFFPIMLEIKDLLHNKRVLGKILRCQSEFCMTMPTDPKHRMNNPDLAGGAILDMGIYPLTWQLNLIYEDPDNKMVEPEVTSSLLKGPTGVDQYTTMLFNWPQLQIQTMATSNVS
jgi:predicted dehydrogenase